MSLLDLNIPIALNTSKNDLINQFFVPALKNSVRYDRGVGYFSSGWLKETFEGMDNFARNGGKARWITSPVLCKADWDAFVVGNEAKQNEILKNALIVEINNLAYSIKHDTLIALAWMISDGILEFKLAKPRNKLDNEYHAKVGIFSDKNGNSISFDGSYNDSVAGLHNFESIKVFRSWDTTSQYVSQEKEWFENIWNNNDQNIEVFSIPEAINAHILKLRENSERPYPLPEWLKIKSIYDIYSISIPYPQIPKDIILRDYQENAINNWFINKKGIFEMATGTGKTITALSIAVKLFELNQNCLTLILCPYIHLANQWVEEAEKFGYRPILVAQSIKKWIEDVNKLVRDFHYDRIKYGAIVATNSSFLLNDFREIFEKYDIWNKILLIVDEMHHCGSNAMVRILPEKIQYRLGLSATPMRDYDEEGSEKLLYYFKDIVYKFDLKDAINKGYLTPYYYYPIPVPLKDDEFNEFIILTNKLFKLHPDPEQPFSEAAQRIAIKRAKVLNNSRSKIDWIRENIQDDISVKHTLFYVGEQIFNEVRKIIGYEKRIIIHEFTHRQSPSKRTELITKFEKGDINAFIAMKCLDEGIDIPPTRTAYFLASSSIPREFIQRRGRILRNSPGKKSAKIFDLISIPPYDYIIRGKADVNYNSVRSALRREYKRITEFALLAENKNQSLIKFLEIANRFDLLGI